MGVKADNMQVGQSVTTTQNFNIRAPLDGTLRLSRGNAGSEISDPIKVESNNDITLAGNLLSGVFGTGQTWQNPTASRALNTNYTNLTGKPIQISVLCGPASAVNVTVIVVVNGLQIYGSYSYASGQYVNSSTVVIPPGSVYSVVVNNGTAAIVTWFELRT